MSQDFQSKTVDEITAMVPGLYGGMLVTDAMDLILKELKRLHAELDAKLERPPSEGDEE